MAIGMIDLRLLSFFIFTVCFVIYAVNTADLPSESIGKKTLLENDPQLSEIVKFATKSINDEKNSLYHFKLVKIIKAESEVAQDTTFFLRLEIAPTNCKKSEYAELKETECTVTSENGSVDICKLKVVRKSKAETLELLPPIKCKAKKKQKSSSKKKNKLHESKVEKTGLLGGKKTSEINKEAQNAAEFAVTELNKQMNSKQKYLLGRIKSVQTQVVSGIMYHIILYMGESSCQNDEALKGEQECQFLESGKVKKCTVKVSEQSWVTPPRKLNHFECKPSSASKMGKVRNRRSAEHLLGAPEETNANLQDLANFAVKDFNTKSNNLFKLIPGRIIHSEQQVVNGKLYKLVMYVAESICHNNNPKYVALADCPVRNEGKVQLCNVTIWEQVWLNQRTVKNFDCEVRNPKEFFVTETIMSTDEMSNEIPQISPPKKNMKLLGADDHDYNNYAVFKQFMVRYNKTYETKKELTHRYQVFKENMKIVKVLQQSELGSAIYGPTKFADFTDDEFKKYSLSPLWKYPKYPMKRAEIPKEDPPEAFDWRDHNVVTPVKDQGMCGSCWAFSTTGNIEGIWAIAKKQLVSLSEQELVDCDKLDEGCNGGLPSNAYKEIIRIGGLETEKDYPYKGADKKCTFDKSEAKIFINDSVEISKDENEMAKWLVKNGPISIGINANAMQFYMGGISHPWRFLCNPDHLDHGVLIVGYGVQGSKPYWIIKNSWGEDWGEKGYYLVYRGDGTCGLNQMCTSALVE